MNDIGIIGHSGIKPAYMADLLKKSMEVETVTIMKAPSCGPTCLPFFGIPLSKIIYWPDSEQIERDIKKKSLPDYIKKSLREAML